MNHLVGGKVEPFHSLLTCNYIFNLDVSGLSLLVIAEPVTEIETEDVVIGTETVEGVTGVM